jgi:hypothetical protein
MKKITESQLKDKVNSLREYLKVYENQQVDEWSVLSPSSWFNGRDYGDSTSRDDVRTQDAAKNSTGGANMALVQNRESLAPGSVASETGKDGVTYAVDAKGMRTHKIESNKWVAMNPPTPTEQPELMGAPDQGASVTPTAPSTQDLTAAASASGEAVGKSLQQFKELLAKAMGTAQPAPAPYNAAKDSQAANVAPVEAPPAQSPYALQANGAKLKANESTTYFLNKLRLIESRQLHEALTAEEEKQLDTLAQSYGDSEDPEIAGLMKQYSDYKNSKQKATPAAPPQAASVTPAATAAPAAPAGPINRDSMTFGQAFADARKKGEKQFPWRGKPYAVKMAPPKPKDPTARTKAALPNDMSYDQYQQSMNRSEEDPAQAGSVTPAVDPNADARKNAGRPGYDEAGTPIVAKESVGYNELQRIVSLVNHR